MRNIPATMATQHPDNASPAYWKNNNQAFIPVADELEECIQCFKELATPEYMWDWEGKYADEAVIDRLFNLHYEYFKKHPLGKEVFLTFRIPNVWQEKAYSLIRALMVILTSEEFAKDLSFHSSPLFEAILPMTEKAEQLMFIQKAFQKLARFKSETFNLRKTAHKDYLELIPLSEGVKHQLNFSALLKKYVALHKNYFGSKPSYLRPFIARSDPALVSGQVATVLANKIALSDIYAYSERNDIPMFPIIGAGSLPFRGGLNPENIGNFLKQHGGIRTVTVQSAFRYDYPLEQVKKSIQFLNSALPKTQVQTIDPADYKPLVAIIKKFELAYKKTLIGILKDVTPVFAAIPARRERRLHIGLLGYQRKMNKTITLPRAIAFCAAFYSLGVPPELIGLGRTLASLSEKQQNLVHKYYLTILQDINRAGHYLNRDNLARLCRNNSAWKLVEEDLSLTEKILGLSLGPVSRQNWVHINLTSNILLLKNDLKEISPLITETGKLRKSLG